MEYKEPTLIQLLHDITQMDYNVQFCGDFKNMIRIEYRNEYDETFYDHSHLSFPDGTMERLEKDIYKDLQTFYHEHKDKE